MIRRPTPHDEIVFTGELLASNTTLDDHGVVTFHHGSANPNPNPNPTPNPNPSQERSVAAELAEASATAAAAQAALRHLP